MPNMPPAATRHENRESARSADVKRGHPVETVAGIEKAGGPTGVRFPIHNHPDKSVVTKGKLKD